jgi:hypothetical protein
MNGLSEIPSAAYYRLNRNAVPNPQDARIAQPIPITGGSRRRRMTRRSMKYKYKKGSGRANRRGRMSRRSLVKYVNYAGRQIGHFSQRQRGNGNKYKYKYNRKRNSRRTLDAQRRSQSGGTTLLPSDANLITSSLGNLVQNGIATLKGDDGPSNPLPFSDKLYERNL